MALKLFQKAAEQQDALAYYHMGHCYERGKGVALDLSRAFDCFMKSAQLGNAYAMFKVGFYYSRLGINHKQAVKWYIKSFNKEGRLDLAVAIGRLYENGGTKLKPDLKEAAKWYEIAKDEKALERVRAQMKTEHPSETP